MDSLRQAQELTSIGQCGKKSQPKTFTIFQAGHENSMATFPFSCHTMLILLLNNLWVYWEKKIY